ncbi:hypothetical protein pb186bvf_012519 [Paramecium bursaria]
MSCPIHTKQYVKEQLSYDELTKRMIKYKAKKKQYKASVVAMRNELRDLLNKNNQFETQFQQNKIKYDSDRLAWVAQKELLQSQIPMKYNFNLPPESQAQQELAKSKTDMEKDIQLKNAEIDNLKQQNQQYLDGLKNQNFEIIQLKALLEGKQQECYSLQNQVQYQLDQILRIRS